MEEEHPRLHLRGFVSLDLCKELEFIHRSCGTVGYRPNVLSTTLAHLVATNCPHLLIPFVAIRERLREKAEELFGCPFELLVEFTGLISWCKGAYIGWHSDDNRPYLKQRDFATVCYLNSHGKDFKGGVFHFQDGEPSAIVPVAGDVLIYTADSRNIHSVDEVTEGERLTLTLWFTRDSAHDEDAKLITLLSERLSSTKSDKTGFSLPLPASDNMYWFSSGNLGFNLCIARLQILGYDIYSSSGSEQNTSDPSPDSSELLVKPIRLGRDGKIFDMEFVNSLHALQVAQFYSWKAEEMTEERRKGYNSTRSMHPSLLDNTSFLELVLPCDHQLSKKVLGCMQSGEVRRSFDWDEFALAIKLWEDHVRLLHTDLLALMPCWVSHQTIFFVTSSGPQKCHVNNKEP